MKEEILAEKFRRVDWIGEGREIGFMLILVGTVIFLIAFVYFWHKKTI